MSLGNVLLIPGIGKRRFLPTSIPSLLWWYDPYDLSTMFQDSAGTTPVTAADQTVGLILDKSLGGLNNLGSELISNGDFSSSAGWTDASDGTASVTISGGVATFASTSGNTARLTQNISGTSNRTYQIQFTVSSYVSGNINLRLTTSGANLVSVTSSHSGSKSYIVHTTGSVNQLQISATGNVSFSLDDISIREVPGYHRIQPSSGSRPILRNSGGLWYLEYDGADDGMYTAGNVDHSVSDEVTVCCGVKRIGNTNIGMFLQLSANSESNNGAFALWTPESPSSNGMTFHNRGTTNRYGFTTTGIVGSDVVATGLGDISASITRLRRNGTQIVNIATSLGSGNYGSYVLYFGRRNNNDLPFNGHEYGSAGFTTVLSGADLANIEQFMADKSGVTL